MLYGDLGGAGYPRYRARVNRRGCASGAACRCHPARFWQSETCGQGVRWYGQDSRLVFESRDTASALVFRCFWLEGLRQRTWAARLTRWGIRSRSLLRRANRWQVGRWQVETVLFGRTSLGNPRDARVTKTIIRELRSHCRSAGLSPVFAEAFFTSSSFQ